MGKVSTDLQHQPPLFVPQGNDGIDACGAARGKVTSRDADQRQEKRHSEEGAWMDFARERATRTHVVQDRIHEASHEKFVEILKYQTCAAPGRFLQNTMLTATQIDCRRRAQAEARSCRA